MGNMLLYGIHLPTWNYMICLLNKSRPFWLRTRQSRKKHCYCQNPGLPPPLTFRSKNIIIALWICQSKSLGAEWMWKVGGGEEGNKTIWNLNASIQLTNYGYIRKRDCTYLPSTSIQCYLLQINAAPSWWYNRRTHHLKKTTIIDKVFNTLDVFFFSIHKFFLLKTEQHTREVDVSKLIVLKNQPSK